jgi:hypothetical protein
MEGGEGCGISAIKYSTWSPNKLWRSNSIFNLYNFLGLNKTIQSLVSIPLEDKGDQSCTPVRFYFYPQPEGETVEANNGYFVLK